MSKFTYRTRSKCSITDRTIFELEQNLPEDLLLNPPETPNSNENDEIWLKFLSNLQEETEDLFDEKDDPDFTFPEHDLELDNDLNIIRIPRKEAFELVKDAAEFVGVSLNDDKSSTKSTPKKLKLNKTLSSQNINESMDEITILNNDIEENELINLNNNNNNKTIEEDKEKLNEEYIPKFNDLQRKQLDEQLRNHVQLITQTCLLCVDKIEYQSVYDECLVLLTSMSELATSKQFDILNLNEAINLVNDNKTFKNTDYSNEIQIKKSEQYMPQKYLDLIVTSPVFYNSKLIPSCKYKFQSQFTRAQFTDVELKLLMIGFDKFGHLDRKDCCDLISEHLLPIRKSSEINRKLSDILKTEERTEKHKKLALEPVQKLGLEFIKERDYKSLIDKSETSLPSMYTVVIERIKMSRLIDERKKIVEMQKKLNPESVTKKFTKRQGEPSEWLKERLGSIDLSQKDNSTKIIINSPIQITNSTNTTKDDSNSNTTSTTTTSTNHSTIQSPIIITNNDTNKIFYNSTNNTNVLNSLLANNLPFSLPPNFQGTIMIQPTIHVHSNGKYIKNEITKYRQIIPKGVSIPNKKRKK